MQMILVFRTSSAGGFRSADAPDHLASTTGPYCGPGWPNKRRRLAKLSPITT